MSFLPGMELNGTIRDSFADTMSSVGVIAVVGKQKCRKLRVDFLQITHVIVDSARHGIGRYNAMREKR